MLAVWFGFECLCGHVGVLLFSHKNKTEPRRAIQPCTTKKEYFLNWFIWCFPLAWYVQSHDQPLSALLSENMAGLSMVLQPQCFLSLKNAGLSVTLPNDVMTLIPRSISGSNWNWHDIKEVALEVKKVLSLRWTNTVRSWIRLLLPGFDVTAI